MSLDPIDTLKDNYEQEFKRKETLENKANNMTTVSGVVAALLFGFGELFVERLAGLQYLWLQHVTFLLLIGVVASLAAIVFSVIGFRVQKYSYVVGNNVLDQPSLMEQIDSMNIAGAANNNNIITAYKTCIKNNAKRNNRKSLWIEFSQWSFVASIAILAIFVCWLLNSPIQFP
jgi:hypothetical protein